MKTIKTNLITSILTTSLISHSSILLAQATSNEEQPSQSEYAHVLEVITVTAQKREQDLQDVPIAVTAIRGDELEAAAITTITDLSKSMPGFTVNESNRPATSTTISLRGIGTSGNDAGLEGAVGVFVNGVYRSRSGMGLGDLVDIDRVEVLRGPQGTLFGKNTSAGALVVETRDPTYDLEGFVEATLGNYNLRRYSAVANLPVIDDKLAIRLSGRIHERDGFVEDTAVNKTYNDRDRSYLMGKVLYEPTDSLSFLLTADVASTDESCCQSVRYSNADGSPIVAVLSGLAGANGLNYPVNPDPFAYETSINVDPIASNDESGASLEVKWSGNNVDLISISSYRDFESRNFNDVDFSPADLVRQDVKFDVTSISQEIRLSGTTSGLGEGVEWLVGGFYSTEDLDYLERVDLGSDLEPYFSLLINDVIGALYSQQENAFGAAAVQDTKAYAIFTHNIFHLTDRMDAVIGLRYTDEEKNTEANPFFNLGVASLPFAGLGLPFAPQHAYDTVYDDDALTGNFSLSYDVADEIRTYISYSTGFKSGGHVFGRDAAGPLYSTNLACSSSGTIAFPAIPPSIPTIYACDAKDPSFDSETVKSYEIGFRSRLNDGALLLNVTLFRSKYDDLQLNTFDGFGFVVKNAGTATTQGLELETKWATPVDGLTLQSNLSYLDTEFGDEVGSLASGQPAVGGEPLTGAPEWSGMLAASYQKPFANGMTGFLNISYSFQDESYTSTRVASDGGEFVVPRVHSLDLSVGLDLQEGFQVKAFCRNCTDENDPTYSFASVVQPGSVGTFLTNPVEYGVSLSKTF